MSVLLEEIKNIHPKTAALLRNAGYVTDSDIKSLTRADLNDLLPGLDNLRLRKTIFDLIHKQKPVDVLLKQLKDFIPHESFRAALTNNGVLVDYLDMLKDMQKQTKNVQEFLEGHIKLLEDIRKSQPEQGPDKGSRGSERNEASSTPKSGSGGTSALYSMFSRAEAPGNPQNIQGSGGHHSNSGMPVDESKSHIADSKSLSGSTARGSIFGRAPKTRVTVRYKQVISGKTFGAEQQLLKVVCQPNDQSMLNLEWNIFDDNGENIIFVFCPIVSRVGTDVDAAMKMVKDNKPVILVLMHHTREPRPVAPYRSWSNHTNVTLHVSVFYHETENGLLKCQENDLAIITVREELLKRYQPTPEDVKWNIEAEALEQRNSEKNHSTSTIWDNIKSSFTGK